MSGARNRLPLVLALATLTMTASMSFLLFQSAPASQTAAPVVVADRVAAATPVPVIEPIPQPSPSPTPAPASLGELAKLRARNRMARDLAREQIWSALARQHALQPAAPGSAAPTPEAAASLPTLDVQYVSAAIGQLRPFVRECHEAALADDPTLAGRLNVELTFIGAEAVAGVIETVGFADTSTLASASMRTCLQAAMLELSFDPPTASGRAEVEFPFEFSAGAEGR